MLSDILPTGYECGVLNGKVAPGSSVAIVGAGPIGLATLLTAQFYAPARIIMIDLDDNRLAVARRFGATHTFNSSREDVVRLVRDLTDSKGVDAAIEARSEEHTSELQSLMRISYAVFCLKQKKQKTHTKDSHQTQHRT